MVKPSGQNFTAVVQFSGYCAMDAMGAAIMVSMAEIQTSWVFECAICQINAPVIAICKKRAELPDSAYLMSPSDAGAGNRVANNRKLGGRRHGSG